MPGSPNTPKSGLPRLHLGCGERYLDGYVNIDLPSEHHTVLATAPDQLADISTLSYPPESVAEVRLHHVFEHFDRPTALRLLIDWHEWLTPGGKLMIETPDFERAAQAFVRRVGRGDRGAILRHVFGSHEAAWAVHWDGWYADRYRRTLEGLGFGTLHIERAKWHGTHNITVTATRLGSTRTREGQLAVASDLLRESLVDESDSERRLLAEWTRRLRQGAAPA